MAAECPGLEFNVIDKHGARPNGPAMRYAIEFFRRTTADPAGKTVDRYVGDFENTEEAQAYGLSNRPEEADGFRLYLSGIPKGTISVRPDKHDA